MQVAASLVEGGLLVVGVEGVGIGDWELGIGGSWSWSGPEGADAGC